MFCAWVSRSASLRAVPAPGDCWLVRKYRSAGAAQAWIERVAKGVTEEVESEHRAEDRESGTDAHPPLEVRQVTDRVVDVLSPRGEGRLRPEAEERQGRLGEDRERGRERRLHDESIGDVREDVPHHDEVERAAQVPRREAERDTDEEADAHRDEADRERDTAAPENARKHVAAEVVGTQEMAGARRKQRVGRIDLDRIVRRDEGSE